MRERERVKGKLNFIKESLMRLQRHVVFLCTVLCRSRIEDWTAKGFYDVSVLSSCPHSGFELRSSGKEVSLSRLLYSTEVPPASSVSQLAAWILCKGSARQVSLPLLCRSATQSDRQCNMSGMTWSRQGHQYRRLCMRFSILSVHQVHVHAYIWISGPPEKE
jgi:hypothetical protein